MLPGGNRRDRTMKRLLPIALVLAAAVAVLPAPAALAAEGLDYVVALARTCQNVPASSMTDDMRHQCLGLQTMIEAGEGNPEAVAALRKTLDKYGGTLGAPPTTAPTRGLSNLCPPPRKMTEWNGGQRKPPQPGLPRRPPSP